MHKKTSPLFLKKLKKSLPPGYSLFDPIFKRIADLYVWNQYGAIREEDILLHKPNEALRD